MGNTASRYPVLVIDSLRDTVLAPASLHGLAGQFSEFYCSACVGGLVSETSGADALGIISALQLQGVGVIVASSAPLPDFYMPILSALYWNGRRDGLAAHLALDQAKRDFRSGDWPQELIELIRQTYKEQVLAVLERVRTDADQRAPALCRTIAGWLWPPSLTQDTSPAPRVRSPADHLRFAETYCGSPPLRQRVAEEVAGYLIARRHDLPRAIVEHVCMFVSCYG